MDKKSKKTSKKHRVGKEAARSEKSDLRPVIHETTPEPPLLRHGEMENPTSVGSPAPTDPGVDHPCGDSPVKEAIRSVDPSGGHEGVKNPLNTVQDSAKVAPSGSHAHHSGDKPVARRSHPQPKEPTSHQGAATVRSLDILLSPDRSDREMDKLVGELEDESVHAAQTKAKAQHFLSTIVAKATGKPSAVAEAWGIPPEALAQSEAERTIRHQTSSAERQVHPRVGDQTLRHRDESAQRPVHSTGSKKGGGASRPTASLVAIRLRHPEGRSHPDVPGLISTRRIVQGVDPRSVRAVLSPPTVLTTSPVSRDVPLLRCSVGYTTRLLPRTCRKRVNIETSVATK